MTSFQKLIAREIPADIVFEDDQIFAFRDIHPQAPVHILIVPKKPIPRIASATAEDSAIIGLLVLTAARIAGDLGIAESGYRLIINNGSDAGESVPHLHLHLMGGRTMGWPPG